MEQAHEVFEIPVTRCYTGYQTGIVRVPAPDRATAVALVYAMRDDESEDAITEAIEDETLGDLGDSGPWQVDVTPDGVTPAFD